MAPLSYTQIMSYCDHWCPIIMLGKIYKIFDITHNAYTHTCMHTYIHTYIHTYKHTNIQTFIRILYRNYSHQVNTVDETVCEAQ